MTTLDAKFLDDCIKQAQLFYKETVEARDFLMASYYKGHLDALTKIQLNCVDSTKEQSP
jgi:hypothetical protein